MELGAAAAAASVGGVGMGLFSYNRENYMFDQKTHFTRFTAGMNMAIAQTGIYKQDITNLTNLTVTRQDCYHGIAAMGLTILTAIYCPGRLGLHTPAPPGWLMGLAFVNIGGCYLFLGLTLWLAMHAAMRADTASTHMLTRFVRLPIPSQGMMDKARKFLASYEEQPLKEVFRIPFTRHQGPGKDRKGDFNEDMELDTSAKRRSRHGFDVPAWYRKEKEVDNVNTVDSLQSMMPLAARGTAPEHFEAYREIQNEWFPYDVYARLSIFLAFMHLTHCWAYMQIGHQLTETRALWACAIVLLPMFVLQQLILTLDIVPNGVPIHRLGPCALWPAYIAAVIEYKRWFTPGAQAVGFALVYVAYGLHVIYTLQLLRICAPASDPPAVSESPGASWWPGEWRLPTAFQHAIWLVAPPKKLQEGENDLVGELRAAQTGGPVPAEPGQEAAEEKRADVHRALGKQGESPAWQNVRIGLLALIVAWLFLIFGFTIEILNQGTSHPSLLNAPGMPNNARDPRYRPSKPGHHEATEVGTGGVRHGPAKGVHANAVHRRLGGETELGGPAEFAADLLASAAGRSEVAQKLRTLLPYLRELSRAGATSLLAKPTVSEMPPHAVADWPALFEPRLLACGAGQRVFALSRHGRGMALTVPQAGLASEMQPFVLEGVLSHGPLVSASVDDQGLLLATVTGAILECPGAPTEGRWRCAPAAGPHLPLAVRGPFAGSAALARAATGLRAAVVFPGEQSVTLFSRAEHAGAPWLPSGEVRALGDAAAAAFANTAEHGQHLLLGAAAGSVRRLDLLDGASAPDGELAGAHRLTALCRLSDGRSARLAAATGEATPRLFAV